MKSAPSASLASVCYQSGLHMRLRDANYAAAYLDAATADEASVVLLLALRQTHQSGAAALTASTGSVLWPSVEAIE